MKASAETTNQLEECKRANSKLERQLFDAHIQADSDEKLRQRLEKSEVSGCYSAAD